LEKLNLYIMGHPKNPYQKAREKNDKWQQRQKSKSSIKGPVGTGGMYAGSKPTGVPVSSIGATPGVVEQSFRPFPSQAFAMQQKKKGGSVKGLMGGPNC
jgi:hypothetical protein